MTRSDSTSRRLFLRAMACAAAMAPFAAVGQGLSKRPVRVIVPFTPATGPDILARLIAPKLQVRWDQPFIVENRPGASGTIGTDAVAKAAPDGHTIMVGPASIISAPHLYAKLPYDVIRDLTPVVNLGSTGLALAVHSSVSVNNAQEFIAYVKARPGQLNYGSPGNGTHHHLCMELFKLQTGIDIVHIPYKGFGGAANDLIAGTITSMFLPIHTALPMQRAGQIKLLGGSLKERHPLFPDLPSLNEQGVKGYDVDLWLGVWGPANMPTDVLARYNQAIREVVAEPDMRAQLTKQGVIPKAGTPAEFAQLVRADYERWGKVVQQARITAD